MSLLPQHFQAAFRLTVGRFGPCAVCGAPLAAPLCGECLAASAASGHPFRSTAGLHELHFAGAYHAPRSGNPRALSPLGACLKAFKDRGDRYAGRCLSRLFADRFSVLADAHCAVVPVPSDMGRLRRRGLSPAAWLAHSLARRVRARLCTNVLGRIDGRPPQRGLGGAARRANAHGAFALGPRSIERYVKERPVILVDDVVTTGATLGDAARCLHEAGVAAIVCVVLACADEELIRSCRSATASAGTNDTALRPG